MSIDNCRVLVEDLFVGVSRLVCIALREQRACKNKPAFRRIEALFERPANVSLGLAGATGITQRSREIVLRRATLRVLSHGRSVDRDRISQSAAILEVDSFVKERLQGLGHVT